MGKTLVWIILFVTIIGYAIVLRLLILRKLSDAVRHLLIGLTAVEFLIAALYITGWITPIPVLGWQFDLVGGEKNATAIFSATQMVVNAVVACINAVAVRPQSNRQRGYWILIAGVFLLIGMDEYFMIHESIPNWEPIYIGIGLLFLVASGLIYWFTMREESLFFLTLILGLGMMAGGGLVVENVVLKTQCFGLIKPYSTCLMLQTVEEFLEMAGGTLILVNLLSYASCNIRKRTWPKIVRALQIALILWAFWLGARYFFIPGIEARTLATPVNVIYPEGHPIQLEGYRIFPQRLSPRTDRLKVTLYWRATSRLEVGYGVSVHLLTHPDIHSLTQNDVVLIDPDPSDWIPGQVMKQTITLDIPEQFDTSRTYWLTATLWQRPWYEHLRLPIVEANRPLVTPDTVILEEVASQ